MRCEVLGEQVATGRAVSQPLRNRRRIRGGCAFTSAGLSLQRALLVGGCEPVVGDLPSVEARG